MRIEDIAMQNPWWKNQAWEYDDRHLKQLGQYEYVYKRDRYIDLKDGIIVAYGPRQTGKTTWLKQRIVNLLGTGIQPNRILYLNVEMVKDRFELYETIKTAKIPAKPEYIFIDEINAVTDWERAIKALADEGYFEGKKTILTGSSSINLLKKTERLPGRLAENQHKFRYYPLSFREIVEVYGVVVRTPRDALSQLDRIMPVLYRYFLHGGFIKAVNTIHAKQELDAELFSVYSAWIDGELAKIKRSPETATVILDGIANALTNDVAWNSLAKGINHVTVSEYAEILRDMFVIEYLEKSKRAGSGAPKNKKIYFCDPFLYWLALFRARKISSMNLAALDTMTMGRLAELSVNTALVQHLDRQASESEFDIRRYVHYEKDRQGEIDFLVNYRDRSVCLECKFGRIEKEKEGVVYLTKDSISKNKLPLALFLMFPEEALQLLKL